MSGRLLIVGTPLGNLADMSPRAVQAYSYHLAYPKVFDSTRAHAVLTPQGIDAPPVLEYYDRIVRWCIESNWGAAS